MDASPQSSRVDGERRAGAFHTPYNTNAFPLIATKARATFTTQLVMMMKCWAAVSVIFASVNPTYQLRLWCTIFTFFQRLFFCQKMQLISKLSFRFAIGPDVFGNLIHTQLQLMGNWYRHAFGKLLCQCNYLTLPEGNKNWLAFIQKENKLVLWFVNKEYD